MGLTPIMKKYSIMLLQQPSDAREHRPETNAIDQAHPRYVSHNLPIVAKASFGKGRNIHI